MDSAPAVAGGWRVEARATPWLANAIAGGAGVLISIGVIAFGIDLSPHDGHGAGWAGFAFCAIAVVAGLVLVDRLPTVLESTGVALVAICIAAAMGFVQFPRIHAVADLRLFFAITIVAWIGAFAVGPAKGRPLLLALALLMALTWATVEVSNVSTQTDFPFGVSSSIGSSSADGTILTPSPDGSFTSNGPAPENDFTFTGQQEPDVGALGVVSLAFGVVYLIGVAVLDARGHRGVATAAVLPGVVAMIDTVIFFGDKAGNVVVAGLLSIAAGLFVGAVGAQSHRRFTVWIGAFGATVGAVLLTGKIADSTTNSGSNSHVGSVFGAFTIVFGAAMVVVAALAARVLREPITGDGAPAPVPPDPPFE
ncbi:MAG TPA: hypothetical protein VH914_18950 [Acidimicrobiia bacterium]|nr:hypothetical protein [Acidimicrobiia bacterium]